MTHEIDPDTLSALNEQSEEPVQPTDTEGTAEASEDTTEDINLELDPDKGDDSGDDSGEPDVNKTVDERLKEAGFDLEDVAKRITENNGEIPDDIIAEAKKKLDPDLVDAHAARLKSEFKLAQIEASEKYQEFQNQAQKTEEMNQYIYKSVGGEDKFTSMAGILRESLDKGALESINAKLLSGNKTLVNEALTTAVSEYKKIKGIGGKRMEGDANAPQEKELKITKEDYRAIMRTEKYKTDPLYRDKVDNARLKTRQNDQKRYGPGTYYGMNQNGRYEL